MRKGFSNAGRSDCTATFLAIPAALLSTSIDFHPSPTHSGFRSRHEERPLCRQTDGFRPACSAESNQSLLKANLQWSAFNRETTRETSTFGWEPLAEIYRETSAFGAEMGEIRVSCFLSRSKFSLPDLLWWPRGIFVCIDRKRVARNTKRWSCNCRQPVHQGRHNSNSESY